MSATEWNPSAKQAQRFQNAFQGVLKSLHVEYHTRCLDISDKGLTNDELVSDWSERIWKALEEEVIKVRALRYQQA